METILVTGGAGYIGSHTVISLVKKGFKVIIVDNFSNSSRKAIEHIEKIIEKEITVYDIDLGNKKLLEEVFKNHKIDAVIHFAGYKAVGESVIKPIKYYENNIGGLLNLISAMEKYLVNNLIFSSSATVYGNAPQMPLQENFPIGGVTNPYANTKVLIEEILSDVCMFNKEWHIVSLRYFNPLGAHESGELGEDPNGRPNNLAPYITQVAVGKLNKLYVFGNDYPTPDGTCIRDYVHVMDLAEGHVAAIEYLFGHACGYEAINLGSGKGYSVFELIKNFENVIRKTIPYKITKRREGDLPISLADITKAKKILGWKPQRDIKEMCKDSWKWQTKHPNGYN